MGTRHQKTKSTIRFSAKRAGEQPETRVPIDLRKVLAATPLVETVWRDLTPTERRDFVEWVQSAKKSEIRSQRVEKACLMLATGKRRP